MSLHFDPQSSPSRDLPAAQPAPIAISMGDPAGIGPEVVLKALYAIKSAEYEKQASHQQTVSSLPKPSQGFRVRVFGDPDWLMKLSAELGCEVLFRDASWLSWESACEISSALQVGLASAEAGQSAVDAVVTAAREVMAGRCRALVTAPLHKQAMHLAGYRYPGHTELLSELAGNRPVRMMLEHRHLRTVLHSIHVSLRQAIEAVQTEPLLETLSIANQSLTMLLGRKPRLFMAALNPHAGEAGAFGREEIECLQPCISLARQQGIQIEGPFAADTVFATAWDNPQVDAVIALYHDQGLIPIKLLGMDWGVNITLGLPYIRSSPDHGTAFDIAKRRIAREHSFLEALSAADRYSLNDV